MYSVSLITYDPKVSSKKSNGDRIYQKTVPTVFTLFFMLKRKSAHSFQRAVNDFGNLAFTSNFVTSVYIKLSSELDATRPCDVHAIFNFERYIFIIFAIQISHHGYIVSLIRVQYQNRRALLLCCLDCCLALIIWTGASIRTSRIAWALVHFFTFVLLGKIEAYKSQLSFNQSKQSCNPGYSRRNTEENNQKHSQKCSQCIDRQRP